jgi:hypothetical protein
MPTIKFGVEPLAVGGLAANFPVSIFFLMNNVENISSRDGN